MEIEAAPVIIRPGWEKVRKIREGKTEKERLDSRNGEKKKLLGNGSAIHRAREREREEERGRTSESN